MHIGLDLGTSSLIAVLCEDGVPRARAMRPLSTASPHPYWSEQQPEDWWQAALSALDELLASLGPGGRAGVRAIGLSGQMHGAVLLDDAGRVLRPAMLWNDGRAHAECAALTRALPEIGMIAGVPPLPGLTAPKFPWLARHEPHILGAVRHVLMPKDYLGYRLHGGHVSDPSDAAGTLLFDQAGRCWSDALCAAAGVDPAWLPALRHGHEVAGGLSGTVARRLGLPEGLPVVTGGGDTATGAVSVGAIEDGAAFLSLGTSGQVFLAGDRYRPNPERLVHAFAHTLPARWYQMAAMLNGARPMAWFAGVAGSDIAPLLAEAETVPPDRVPLFLPYLTGERTPHGDPHIRGAFYGLEDGTGRAAMMRAVVEAVAFCFADAFDSLDRGAGIAGPIPAIGGGTRSDFLLRTIADVTGHAIGRASGATAGPSIGAAKLAALATGDLSRDDIARRPVPGKVFEPRSAPVLGARLQRWRALYTALKPLTEGGA